MAINLQYAIDFASGQPSFATVVVSMHDAAGVALFGFANPTFRDDVPLVYGTASIGRSPIGRRSGIPGFSTRGDPPPPPPASNELLRSDETTGTGVPPQRFAASKPVPMEFSVRRNPGFSRYLPPPFGPSVQIEIRRSPQLVARWFMQLVSTRPRTETYCVRSATASKIRLRTPRTRSR